MGKKTLACFLVLTIVMSIPAFALSEAEGEAGLPALPSGMKAEDVQERIDEYLGSINIKDATCAAAIIQNGKAFFSVTGGSVETDNGLDTVYRWGEITSILTWISVMQLYEQGKVSLEEDIREYLPEGFLRRLSYTDKAITIENLMNQNAGWEQCWKVETFMPKGGINSLEEILRFGEPKQIYAPGEVRTESAYATALAAYIVERVSGAPFYQYVNERIFKPLDMADSSINPDGTDNPDLAERMAAPIGADYTGLLPTLYPAFGAYGTISDLSKLMLELIPQVSGGKLFEQAGTLELMLKNSYSVTPYFPGIAHGIPERRGAVRTLGLSVELAGYGGEFVFSPEADAGYIMLSNSDNNDYLINTLFNSVIGKASDVVPDNNDEMPVAAGFAGDYMPADHPGSGHREFAEYLRGLLSLSAVKYGDRTRSLLYINMRIFASQYVAKGYVTFYSNQMTQIKPQFFWDGRDSYVYFHMEDGEVKKVLLGDGEFVPARGGRSVLAIDLSTAAMYACALYFIAAAVCMIVFAIRNKKQMWRSSLASKLAAALNISGLLLILNNGILLCYSTFNLTYRQCGVHFILNYALTGLVVLSSAGIAVTWKRSELFVRQKICYALSMLISALSIALMIIWELYS